MKNTIPASYPKYGKPNLYERTGKVHITGRELPEQDPITEELRKKGRVPVEYTSLETMVRASGLKDGMRISFHHHLRLGDTVMQTVLEQLQSMGFRDLTVCVSSVMGPPCAALLKAVRSGLVGMIETTGMKEPLSAEVQNGTLGIPVVFRSHGGRARAIMEGEISIDVAFIATSAVDSYGNATGTVGPNRFGSVGYALPDALKANYTAIITDHRQEDIPISIACEAVDGILRVPSIGEKAGIAGGSIRRTKRPVEQLIAAKAAEVLIASGLLVDGFSYQAGSGGISLEVSMVLAEYLKEQHITASFISGGITAPLVDMLRSGLVERLYDVQSFDDEAAASLSVNSGHIEMSAALYADPHNPDCIAERLDVMVLSATEVDLDFNINSVTGTDGRILGALGGGPDTAAGALLTVVVIPTFRGRIPTLCREVRTICTPGTTVDVVVTERGICVNPERRDLEETLNRSGIETLPIEDLLQRVHRITGVPGTVAYHAEPQALIEYRDGTVIDVIT